MKMYRIKDWGLHYEKAESRRVKTMAWLPMPTRHDGAGFRRVAAHERGPELFAAWVLIVEVAAKMPTRGHLVKDGKPLTVKALHSRTGFAEAIFVLAFKVLTGPEIGRLEVINEDTGEIVEIEEWSPAIVGYTG